MALQEVAVLTPDGEVFDQPLELARLTDRHVRYAAVHAFALIEPENGRAIGAATWGNALLTRAPVQDGFAVGLPVGGDDDLVEPAGSGLPLAGVTFRDAPYGTREARCAVGGRVSLAGGELAIVNAHLTYAGTEQRRAQADELARIAAGVGRPGRGRRRLQRGDRGPGAAIARRRLRRRVRRGRRRAGRSRGARRAGRSGSTTC